MTSEWIKEIPNWEKQYKEEMQGLLTKRQLEILDGPYIEADGGILEFVAIDYLKDGPVVMVKLLGACSTCAMSAMTLKQGIESHLQNKWPEIQEVIQV